MPRWRSVLPRTSGAASGSCVARVRCCLSSSCENRLHLGIVPLLPQGVCVGRGIDLVVRPILIRLGAVWQRLIKAELQRKDGGAAKVVLRGAIDARFIGLDQAVEDRARLLKLALVQQVLRGLYQRRIFALGGELLLGLLQLGVEFVVPARPVVSLGGLLLQVQVHSVEQVIEVMLCARIDAIAGDVVVVAVLRRAAPAAIAGRLRYLRRHRSRRRRKCEKTSDEKTNCLRLHGLPLMMTVFPLPFCAGELVPVAAANASASTALASLSRCMSRYREARLLSVCARSAR